MFVFFVFIDVVELPEDAGIQSFSLKVVVIGYGGGSELII
jgi:hypothetical protein